MYTVAHTKITQQLGKDPLLFNQILVIHDLKEAVTREDLQEHFQQFGKVQHVNMKKKPEKGYYYTFIKFTKTSEALRAVENMRGQRLPGLSNFKVLLADFNKEYLEMDLEFNEMLHTLFVTHPKHMTDKDVKEHFKQFGDLNSVDSLRDRNTGTLKGVSFVKFVKQSDAAVALEEIRHPYKAKWANVRLLSAEQINVVRLKKHQAQYGMDTEVAPTGIGKLMDFNGSGYDDDMQGMMGGGMGWGSGAGAYGASAYGAGGMDYDNYGEMAHSGGMLRRNQRLLANEMTDYGGGMDMLGDDGFGGGRGMMAEESFRAGSRLGAGFGAGDSLLGSGDLRMRSNMAAASAFDRGGDAGANVATGEQGTTLEVLIPQVVSLEILRKIFDICPGLVSFQRDPGSRMAKVSYESVEMAAHAKEKIDGLELNQELIAVRYPPAKTVKEKLKETLMQLKSGNAMANFTNIVSSLEEAISGAVTSDGPLIKERPGVAKRKQGAMDDKEMVHWANVPMPFPKPLAPPTAEVKAEIFIRGKAATSLFPDEILCKVLCRFGDLIKAFWVKAPEKREAFARFGSVAAAENCMTTLDGATVFNIPFKIMWSKNSPWNGTSKEKDNGLPAKKSRIN